MLVFHSIFDRSQTSKERMLPTWGASFNTPAQFIISKHIVSWLVCPKERRRHNNIYTICITVPFQVRSITDENIPLQSGSVFYVHAKLTGAQYKHRVYIYSRWSYNNMIKNQFSRQVKKLTSYDNLIIYQRYSKNLNTVGIWNPT